MIVIRMLIIAEKIRKNTEIGNKNRENNKAKSDLFNAFVFKKPKLIKLRLIR